MYQACKAYTLFCLAGMQDIMTGSFTDDAPGASTAVPVHSEPLLEDPNDDFCRVCGFGVSITMQVTATAGKADFPANN